MRYRTADVAKIIWKHGKRNYALRTAGVMPIVCPVGDGSGVEAGVFTYEVHPTRGFPGTVLPGTPRAPESAGGDQ
ncbi:MAG TPA: hypothetical protein VGJ53_11115 [Micromonosporaceae bacterium]|jgi:hypothetical protein